MSDPLSPKDLVAKVYRDYGRGDLQSVFPVVADDITLRAAGAPERLGFAGEWHGRDGLQAFLSHIASDWTIARFEPVEMIAEGERVAVRAMVTARHRRTRRVAELEAAHFWTVRDGKISSYQEIDDTALLEPCLA